MSLKVTRQTRRGEGVLSIDTALSGVKAQITAMRLNMIAIRAAATADSALTAGEILEAQTEIDVRIAAMTNILAATAWSAY